jgi:hypothetical protein
MVTAKFDFAARQEPGCDRPGPRSAPCRSTSTISTTRCRVFRGRIDAMITRARARPARPTCSSGLSRFRGQRPAARDLVHEPPDAPTARRVVDGRAQAAARAARDLEPGAVAEPVVGVGAPPEWRIPWSGPRRRRAAAPWYFRVSPNLPESRRAAIDFYTDLAVYLPINGILFDDDAYMLEDEELNGTTDAKPPTRPRRSTPCSTRCATRSASGSGLPLRTQRVRPGGRERRVCTTASRRTSPRSCATTTWPW